ncbi:MAG: 7-cyano-7-deazaguanine synthase, partial [Candidatus Omnitrophica bacterium]|nr:7-cyano-7-deazaguanine synthase [Candidatus Omnitrophota bacterium]
MKAVALFSGGLDSTLAIKVMVDQGTEVVALNFTSPFCRCQRGEGCSVPISSRAKDLGVTFKSMYLGEEYLEIVKNPKHGYGRNCNPCIDCRILKLKKARILMETIGASFLITGEVLGQRPMSQHREALRIIEKESGLEGLILRPLSAKLFEPTLPEKKGWVNREALLDISGRTRKPQIQLADQLGIKDYPCPAGGCLLADPGFSKRLRDIFQHDEFNLDNVELLKIGR